MRRRRRVVLAALAVTSLGVMVASPMAVAAPRHADPRVVGRYRHLVVIYEENHSFDNLYGSWGPVFGHRVDGLPASGSRHTVQVAQNGEPYNCLLQNDVNLTAPTPLTTTCTDSAHGVAASHFANEPFTIDAYIPADATTCPAPGVFAANGVLDGTGLPGGCTRDLVHRFYQEQYQLDDGRQDRYVTGSDAVGLTMGGYDTRQLPIWQYLHGQGAPHYVIADRFFQAAFGGSFLNHQFLVAARAPLDTSNGADGASNSVLDANGFPTTYPLYTPTTTGLVDGQLTRVCGPGEDPAVVSCGNYAVNTIQPFDQPHSTSTIRLPRVDDTAFPNIGDRLSDAGISWNWYSGGWDNAAGNVGGSGWTNGTTPGTCTHPRRAASAVYPFCADALFQYHHQPLNYFANYAPGAPGRAHLRDETEFLAAATAGTLPTVSFVKPVGEENEHPGYASERNGSTHLVDLLRTLTTGPQGRDTLVVVTYDEFGGQWDHVPPPGMGTRGAHDAYGPGTRIPALVVSASLPRSGVDHTVYDTTSILATIERGLHLAPLSRRDARVNDLRNAVAAGWPD